ncbi:MAG TPA: histidinol dehydrogenase, partial [Stellaceae bacterium]|nr:histidinol dehydrogenase [Stellaceae bacterium]
MPLRLDRSSADFDKLFATFLAAKREASADVEAAARAIVGDVAARGDQALIEATKKFDRLDLDAARFRVSADEIDAAVKACVPETLDALTFARDRIEAFHCRQLPRDERFTDGAGVELGWRWSAIEAVGLYVPGGTAAYPSSVLMSAVPAKVAGVDRLVMVVPAPDGKLNPLVLAAARLGGVSEIYRLGGAQAIAALAYGTATVPAVDKICGPGNAYVAAAKRRVFGVVGIDLVAGASEVLVIADGTAHPDWVAMDLFSQAEHDELAQALLVSPDAALIDAVAASAARLIATMPRRTIIAAALANRGALIKVRDLDAACAIANRIAPEHLELAVAEPAALLPKIRHAGAIFMGHHASESLGDYCAGPNHVLPTGATARFGSPLGVYEFIKRMSIIGG